MSARVGANAPVQAVFEGERVARGETPFCRSRRGYSKVIRLAASGKAERVPRQGPLRPVARSLGLNPYGPSEVRSPVRPSAETKKAGPAAGPKDSVAGRLHIFFSSDITVTDFAIILPSFMSHLTVAIAPSFISPVTFVESSQ